MSRPLKATALICVLCLLLTVPAYAAVGGLSLSDHLYDVDIRDNGTEIATYQFNTIAYHTVYNAGTVYFDGNADAYSHETSSHSSLKWSVWPLGVKQSIGEYLKNDVASLDLRELKKYSTIKLGLNTAVNITYSHISEASHDGEVIADLACYFLWYKEDGSFLTVTNKYARSIVTLPELADGETGYVNKTLFSESLEETFPEAACFLSFYYTINFTFTDQNTSGVIVEGTTVNPDAVCLFTNVNYLKENTEALIEVNEKLDEIIQQPEQEKQEASSGGQSAADELASAIPNESQGFMTAIQELAGAMSYDGTEASLTFPSITLPEIPGVMPKYVLTKPYQIDFGFWVQKMPEKLLTLVQVLCTLGLVVYCFKELYGMISYAMTLKGGSSDG